MADNTERGRTETRESAGAPPRPPGKPFVPRAHRRRRLLQWGIPAAVVVLVLAGLWGYSSYTHESTDDAFVDAHISSIAARVEGQVTRVLVDDNQRVKAGDLLVEIDPPGYQAALDQDRARLASAQATSRRADLDLARYQRLLRTRDINRQQVDTARADADSARANVAQAEAALRQAELNLSYTRVIAPQDGLVTKRTVSVGDYLKVGTPMLAIVPNETYVTANFKETQLGHIKVGQKVEFTVDSYPGVKFQGHVDSFQSGTGAQFSTLPPENATGNYVKVVQRIPVKILVDGADEAHRLIPGMSVVPKVRVR